MKKIRNCKVILALAICLTMFTGLAMTASAYTAPNCSVHYTQMGYYGKVTCPNKLCQYTQAKKYVCKYSTQCKHYVIYCDRCKETHGVI